MNISLYCLAKSLLGKHLTLDNSVSPDVGCAEAVSKILSLEGIDVPAGGIPGTISLYEWMKSSPLFEEVMQPMEGVIIISPTVGSKHGHVGLLGALNVMYNNDWGIMSNDSDTGLLREKWSLTAWEQYYAQYLGLSIFYFNLKV